MILCQNCKTEYDDIEKVCPKCGKDEKAAKGKPAPKWVVLTKVRDDIEFEMVKDVLEMADITAVRNVKGIDGFVQIILGVPFAGIEVLVPEDKLEEARQLLEAAVPDEEFDDEEME